MSDVGGDSPIESPLKIYFSYLSNLNMTRLDIIASMLFHHVSLALLRRGTGSDDMLSPCSAPTGQSWSVHMKLHRKLQIRHYFSQKI